MNFGQMKAAIFDDLNYQANPSPIVINRVERWVNEAHNHVLRLPGMTGLRQGTVRFTSEADRAYYGLPQVFERIDAIVQESNNIRLLERTRDWYRSVDPGERSNGNPYVYVPEGLQQAFRQPDETGVWIASDDSGDTTQVVRLVGIRADGDQVAEATATLNGLTRVQIGTLTDYVWIQKWDVSSTCAGIVMLYDAASSGNELARLPVGRTAVQYEGIRLWPTPSAALDYVADGQFLIPTLTHDEDVPMLPESYHDMLPCYVRFREYKKSGDAQRAAMEQSEWQNWIGRLQAFVEYTPDYRPVAGTINDDNFRWNNLGSWFAPDGWGY